jgi:hypothetical protein
MSSHREDNVSARLMYLVGKLDACRRRTDNEHATLGKLIRAPVVRRHELVDRRRQISTRRRHRRPIAITGGDYNRRGAPRIARGRDQVRRAAIVAPFNSENVAQGFDGRPGAAGVLLEKPDEFARAHETIGVVAFVRESGQSRHPVRRQQAE